MTITIPMAIPIKHRLRTVVASSGSSVKNETTKPKIPVAKINKMPQPSAAFTEPKAAFLILKLDQYPGSNASWYKKFIRIPQSA